VQSRKISDMIIGVISEGHADRAVITNILIGLTGLDRTDIISIRPEYSKDETDKARNPKTFSTWSIVQEECKQKDKIAGFLALEGHDFVAIHLDTAEAHDYGVTKPNKRTADYGERLRKLVINKINSWLNEDMSRYLLYAIAIEETEAWILPIYKKADSLQSADPKRKLAYVLGQKGLDSTSHYDNYLILSEDLSKKKKASELLKYNSSLRAFFEEINAKVLPKQKDEK
jgi:hypothetical protein